MNRRRTNEWTMDEVRSRCDEVGNCLIWRQSVNSGGAPSASVRGKTMTVRRLVYVELLSKELKAGRRLTVRCHNPLCVSESCIVQRTQADILRNARQRALASDPMILRREQRAGSRAKLNPEIAAQVRNSDESTKVWAKRLNVHPETIRGIRRGHTYVEPQLPPGSVFALASHWSAAA